MPNLLLVDRTLRGTYNCMNSKIEWNSSSKMFRPNILFPSCSTGCANLWVCRLVHGGECSVMLCLPKWKEVVEFAHSLWASLQNYGEGWIESCSRKQSFDVWSCVRNAPFKVSQLSYQQVCARSCLRFVPSCSSSPGARGCCVQSDLCVLSPCSSKWE